jgi:hypothetical protein
MPDSLLRQVALVSESNQIDPSDLAAVSAALQKQASRDLVQFWDIKATVDAFPKLEDVPIGYWPIIVRDDINVPGAAGIHMDQDGQPFALVTAHADRDIWSLTCSHELVEMLVDPFGNRMIAGDSPKPDQSRVQILVEPCDPSEAAEFAYTVNGVLMSDFYTVRYFDPVASPSVRYSFTSAIQEPRQVLRGGYLSWVDPTSDIWWQEIWFEGDAPRFRELGRLDARNGSFRSQIDRLTAAETQSALSKTIRAAMVAGLPLREISGAYGHRAARLHAQIDSILGTGQPIDAREEGTTLADDRRPSRRRRSARSEIRAAPSIARSTRSRDEANE